MIQIRLRAAAFLAAAAALFMGSAIAGPSMLLPFDGPVAKSARAKPFMSEGRAVRFNFEALKALKPGEEAELALPNGLAHTFVVDLLQDHGDGNVSWIGYLKGHKARLRAVITTGPAGSYGRIATPEGEFRLVPGDGHDWLVDMVAEQPFTPPIDLRHDARPIPPKSKSALLPADLPEPTVMDVVPGVNAVASIAKAAPTPNVVVDLLIVYTSGLNTKLGAGLMTRFNNLVAHANTAYADSEVAITLRLVGTQMVSYSDTVTSDVALDDISPVNAGKPVAAFAGIEALRTSVGADMVAFLRDGQAFGGDGIAWIPNGPIDPTDARFMYSVITGCTSGCDSVFIHELGHNMGNMHDRATVAWENNGGQPIGSFSYSYGHYSCQGGRFALSCAVFTPGACVGTSNPECTTPRSGTNNFVDLMAYFFNTTTLNYKFSNPNVSCVGALGGTGPCGVVDTAADSANNALSMNNNRVALSQLKGAILASSTTTLVSSLNPSNSSQAVTFTANVTGASGAPTGTVAFRDNGTALPGCGAVAIAAGAATCTATLGAGSHPITAAYSGNATYNPSASGTVTQVVNAVPVTPSMTFTSSQNPSVTTQPVLFSLNIAATNGAVTGTVDFRDGAGTIAGCAGVALSGGIANCVTSALAAGTHSVTAAYSGNAAYLAATSSAISQVVNASLAGSTNVALASAGAVASASSQFSASYPASAVNNGDRAGLNPDGGGMWIDGTPNVFPDSITIVFNGMKNVDRVGVYTMQDGYTAPGEPSDGMVFTLYGATGFNVEAWNGTAFATVASVLGNSLVKRVVSFPAVQTDRIRVTVTAGLAGRSRLAEIEAFGTSVGTPPPPPPVASTVTLSSSANPSVSGQGVTFSAAVSGSAGTATGTMDFRDGGVSIAGCGAVSLVAGSANCTTSTLSAATHAMTAVYSGSGVYNGATSNTVSQVVNPAPPPPTTTTNVALAANGGVASTSSQFSGSYPAGALNNGDRAGTNPDGGGVWIDGTPGVFPDTATIVFNGSKTIDRVVVYTMQDGYTSPVEPTDTMTFGLYGVTAFTVEAWNGSAFVTLSTVTGNNLVKRTVTFPPTTTDRIRVTINGGLATRSRLTEIEAFTSTGTPPPPPPPSLAVPTVALASSLNPSATAQSVTFTATVSGSAGTPTGTVTFNDGGSPLCTAVALAAGVATCSTSALPAATHSIVASYSGNASYNTGTSNVVSQVVNAPAGGPSVNVALASAGGVASVSSIFDANYPAAALNNNNRAGNGVGAGGVWIDGTADVFPDSATILFNGSKTIDRVVVYTMQDNFNAPVEPSDTMTFAQYGVTGFTVETWNGSAFVNVATVTGNSLVKRTVTFPAVATDRVRVTVTGALASRTRLTEIEAWTSTGTPPPPLATPTVGLASSLNPSNSGQSVTFTATVSGSAGTPTGTVNFLDGASTLCAAVVVSGAGTATCTTAALSVATHAITAAYSGSGTYNAGTSSAVSQVVNGTAPASTNVALASAGAVATASSVFDPTYPASAVNNGNRAGNGVGAGGVWIDGTTSVFPDSVTIQFSGSKTIDRVVVYTMQDNFNAPVDPSDTMTFSQYGVTAFVVEGWNGSAFVPLGTVTGNNLVKRTVTFAPMVTDRIRVTVNNALATRSRLTEIEAWGN